mmetsp:Transcript_42532/g.129065  ORF Transcript_42532/g.129065 Transcript_42532/m.129065 type:complete len:264 (-) Transcript_42532:739-1530(-)
MRLDAPFLPSAAARLAAVQRASAADRGCGGNGSHRSTRPRRRYLWRRGGEYPGKWSHVRGGLRGRSCLVVLLRGEQGILRRNVVGGRTVPLLGGVAPVSVRARRGRQRQLPRLLLPVIRPVILPTVVASPPQVGAVGIPLEAPTQAASAGGGRITLSVFAVFGARSGGDVVTFIIIVIFVRSPQHTFQYCNGAVAACTTPKSLPPSVSVIVSHHHPVTAPSPQADSVVTVVALCGVKFSISSAILTNPLIGLGVAKGFVEAPA